MWYRRYYVNKSISEGFYRFVQILLFVLRHQDSRLMLYRIGGEHLALMCDVDTPQSRTGKISSNADRHSIRCS